MAINLKQTAIDIDGHIDIMVIINNKKYKNGYNF